MRHHSLTRSRNRAAKTKALLAIAFASNMLTAPMPGQCEEAPGTSTSIVEFIAKSAQARPEVKAFYLLKLAQCCLWGKAPPDYEAGLEAELISHGSRLPAYLSSSTTGERLFDYWVSITALPQNSAGAKASNTLCPAEISEKSRDLANKAIDAAMEQLSQDPTNPKVLRMYLVASSLSKITNNKQNVEKCTRTLDSFIQGCESDKSADIAQIKLTAVILNSLAYRLMPVSIPYTEIQPNMQEPPIEMKNFDQCEQLKLRAAALLDRLPTGDHERRKAHRDLSLWYSKLGKGDKALKEKEELFNLVGVKDDAILYPADSGCGHVVWWTVQKSIISGLCGMG